MKKEDLYRYTGTHEQLFGIKDYKLMAGKSDGMRVIEVYNEKGTSFDILADRGMDIANLKYKGKNISFLSNVGLVSSKYFVEADEDGFMNNFFVGFLTTCGITYMGASCEDEGKLLGLHGRISNTPASIVRSESVIDKESGKIIICGHVKESQVFGPHINMVRTIELGLYDNTIKIKDAIENQGFEKTPFMMLYHFNIGFPFLNENLRIKLNSKRVTSRDDISEKNIKNCLIVESPEDGRQEEVFFHDINSEDGFGIVKLENDNLNIGLDIKYPIDQLPYFTEWKSMRSGEYVMGFEPGNCDVNGRKQAKENNILEYIGPNETKTIETLISLYDLT